MHDLWCHICKAAVSLRFVIDEKLCGIASKLLVRCQGCQTIITVETSKTNASNYYYDTNLKLAVGM